MIIAFSGKANSGKSTAARYLERVYGFKQISFAAKLKLLAQEFYPFTYEQLYGSEKDVPYLHHSWTPREFLITLGEMIRFFDPEYLVRNLPRNYSDMAVDDLRFLNEAADLSGRGSRLIRIERLPKHLKTNDTRSETELDTYGKWDAVINTTENRGVQALYARLDEIMESFGHYPMISL